MSGSQVWGLPAGTFQAQPDFMATQIETGGWRATQSYLTLEASLGESAFRNNFSGGVAPTTLDSSLPGFWSFLGLSQVDVRVEPGGIVRLMATFVGFWATGDDGPTAPTPVYELRGEGTVSRSILEHPTVKGFGNADRELLAEVYRGNAYWDGTNLRARALGGGGTWIEENYPTQPSNATVKTWCGIVQAQQTYEASRYVWVKRWQDDEGVPAADLNNLGKIDVPENDPVEPGANYDWRLTSASQIQEGPLYDNTLEWTLSEEGKWDTNVYS